MDLPLIIAVILCIWTVLRMVGGERHRQLQEMRTTLAIRKAAQARQSAETIPSV